MIFLVDMPEIWTRDHESELFKTRITPRWLRYIRINHLQLSYQHNNTHNSLISIADILLKQIINLKTKNIQC